MRGRHSIMRSNGSRAKPRQVIEKRCPPVRGWTTWNLRRAKPDHITIDQEIQIDIPSTEKTYQPSGQANFT